MSILIQGKIGKDVHFLLLPRLRHQGRLSKEDIERMVNEAEKYAEEDEIAKGKIAAKNSFESYIFNVKNTLDDEKLKVGGVVGC